LKEIFYIERIIIKEVKGSEVVKFKYVGFSLLTMIFLTGCMSMQTPDGSGSVPRLKTNGAVIYVNTQNSLQTIFYLNLSNWQETVLYQYSSNATESNPIWYCGQPSKIILADKIEDNYDIIIYDLLTQEKVTESVYNSSKTDRHPSLDRMGRKMVFQSAQKENKTRVYLYVMGSNQPLQLMDTEEQRGRNPVISPDGTKIAYIVDGDQDRLYVRDLSGGSGPDSVLVPNEYDVDNPCWAPDSRTLAVDLKNSAGKRYIYSVKPFEAVPEWQQISFDWGKGDHRHPIWSEDGSIIFFTGKTSSSRELCAVYFDEAKQKGSQAQWYLVSDGKKNVDEPCWAGGMELPSQL
jgi:Tol biopolymer transport system component